ncbi:TPA: hypothetical protein ACX6PS_000553 [Photobacterium damselae]
MTDKTPALGMVSATSNAAYGVTESLESPISMMNSSLSQLLQGEFTLYSSDVVVLAGVFFNVALLAWQLQLFRRHKSHGTS